MKIQSVFVVILVTTGVARAAENSMKAQVVPQLSTFSVAVPQTEMYLPALLPPVKPGLFVLEVQASSWTPTNLVLSTPVQDHSDFHTSTISRVSINAWNTNWSIAKAYLTPKVGVSYAQLQRDGNISIGSGQNLPITQVMNVYSLRLGLEVSTSVDPINGWHPYFGLAALPTWEQSPSGPFNQNGFSQNIWAGEVSTGIGWYSKSVADYIGTQRFGLVLGGEATGGLENDSFRGYGVTAGTRISM